MDYQELNASFPKAKTLKTSGKIKRPDGVPMAGTRRGVVKSLYAYT